MSRLWENDSFYFGEDDFKESMAAKVAPLYSRFCMEGYLPVSKGVKIHYHYLLHPNSKGTIVIFHGFCEGFFKYHEVMYYFYQAGYSVFLPEMRGHGFSVREVEDEDMVHIDDFSEYVEDLREFMEQVVLPMAGNDRMILYSHSMGGCVGALFLEQYPGYFSKAIFSAPMFSMDWGHTNPILVKLLFFSSRVFHRDKKFMPGQHRFVKENPYPKCSAISKARYDYQFDQRLAHCEYHTSGGDYSWGRAAASAMRKSIHQANRITIPALLLVAGKDTLVTPQGQYQVAKKNPKIRLEVYPESKHEIYNAATEDRISYYKRLFQFMEEES